jgi:hypothetical protein
MRNKFFLFFLLLLTPYFLKGQVEEIGSTFEKIKEQTGTLKGFEYYIVDNVLFKKTYHFDGIYCDKIYLEPKSFQFVEICSEGLNEQYKAIKENNWIVYWNGNKYNIKYTIGMGEFGAYIYSKE